MDPDLQKLVNQGALGAKEAEALELLKPGEFCLHKSWGFGQVESWSLLSNQIVIHFDGKKDHAMQLNYAATTLRPLAADHFLVQRHQKPDEVKALAKSDPGAVLRIILQNLGGRATQDVMQEWLVPRIFTEAEAKKWWETAKKTLRKDGHFAVPARKTDPWELREIALLRGDELIEVWNKARSTKQRFTALDALLREPEALAAMQGTLVEIVNFLEDYALKHRRLDLSMALQSLLLRDDLCSKFTGMVRTEGQTVAALVEEERARIGSVISDLPAGRQRQLVFEFPNAFGEGWIDRALSLLPQSNARLVGEISRLFVEMGEQPRFLAELRRRLSERQATSEMLIWLCRERTGTFKELVTPQLFGSILAALEIDQLNESRSSRLRDMVLDDRELLADLFRDAEVSEIRDLTRRLLLSSVFDDLNTRSLMARIIRLHPEVQELLSGDSEGPSKEESLVVSWTSLQRRKEEYEEIVNKRIPENSKEIGIARSYGDLRENFEFKAAKEMQAVLMRRKAELEHDLARAQGTNFETPDTSMAGIGTVVTVLDLDDGSTDTFTILGAWDSEPAKHILSYMTSTAKALLSHKVGEEVLLPQEAAGERRCRIVSIEPYLATVEAEVPSLSTSPTP